MKLKKITTIKQLNQMTTVSEDFNKHNFKDFNSEYSIDKYLEDSLVSKYQNKPNRMIKQVLNDGTLIVGKNKYDVLKKIPLENRSELQVLDIKNFEDFHGITEYVKTAQKNVKIREDKLIEIEKRKENAKRNVNKETVFKVFKDFYKKVNGVDFKETEETKRNIHELVLYFSKDEEFLSCGVKDDNGSFLSKPSLDKGICIIGGFGNGKTSVMNTFQRMFIGLEGFSFGRFSSQEIVMRYEHASKQNDSEHVENFWRMLTRSTLYIDDIKAEPEAFAYGKKNIINTLFLERYNKKLKTHITINYATGHNGDVLNALLEFKSKYSNQVYDRIYEMYNIIEFKGKSFRK